MFLQTTGVVEESVSRISEYEEKVWFLQLQQPEAVARSMCTWELGDDINLGSLQEAILWVIDSLPNLNARYDLNDDGEVVKCHVSNNSLCLSSVSLGKDIFHYLSQRKALDWQADQHPPFFATIANTHKERFLVLEFHPILNEIISFEDTIEKIDHRYQHLVCYERSDLDVTSPFKCRLKGSQGQDTFQLEDSISIANLILDEFKTVLNEPDMSINDDFFDWGGHSLLATRVIGKLNKNYGFELSFNDFFRSATAKGLASEVTIHQDMLAPQEEPFEPHVDSAPLTLAQNFLWQAYSGYDFSPIYNLPFAIMFLNELDEDIFCKAFEDVLIRHTGLRTHFQIHKGEVTQHTVSAHDLSHYKWFWRSEESNGITLSDEANYTFDLTQELPLRVRFIDRDEDKHQILSVLIHHMVIDEWSLATIMQDLSEAYLSRARHESPHWQTSVPGIHEFAQLQALQGVNREHLGYWTKRLAGAPKGLDLVNLKSDQLSIERSRGASTEADWMELHLDLDAFPKLNEVARRHQASIFGLLYSAIALSLHCYSDADEMVIGTSASGRTDANFFDTVGYFTTMVAHRIDFDQYDSLADLVMNVSEQINDSMSYADIPINLIQEALGCPIEGGLIFDVYVHIHSNNALTGSLKSPSGDIFYQQIPPEKKESMFGIHFEIMDDILPNGDHLLRVVITYQKERYSKSVIEKISRTLNEIIRSMYATKLKLIMIDKFNYCDVLN